MVALARGCTCSAAPRSYRGKTTQAGKVPALAPPRRLGESGFLAIDPATRASLEIDRTQRGEREGSLLACIDRTVTSGGARALAERIAAQAPLAVQADTLPAAASFEPGADLLAQLAQAPQTAVNRGKNEVNEDIMGLRLLCLYGLKGAAAYMEHARVLDQQDAGVAAEFHRIMSWLGTDPSDLDPLFKCAMDIGLLNFKIMEMLDLGETTAFGHPEPTQVRVTPVPGKCILVSGHDMVDLKLILEQTRGTGINVYTHGEMLPAHGYPELKKYPHLVGNYGTAWQNQQKEFAAFPGAIVMTSNCIINPDVGNYKDRIYTRSIVGWPGATHIEGDDFAEVIAKAQSLAGYPHNEIPAYTSTGFARNALMGAALRHGLHATPWSRQDTGHAHVERAAGFMLFTEAEPSILCPVSMSYAVTPALRGNAAVWADWNKGLTSTQYDPRLALFSQKSALTMGMGMTEKQGGTDVRANTTKAYPVGASGPGQAYELVGHKWFCSAPMCDAFLTLAQTDKGLSCFLLPRHRPDDTRNQFYIQRLKNKLGNCSNASSEVEFRGALAWMVGEEGRGVPTIIEMVAMTRFDCMVGSSALMRQALTQASHHCAHRLVGGRVLADQPLMQNVLADLALESEAALALSLRMGRALDHLDDSHEARFSRLVTAVGKYWICKRAPAMINEAAECMGGAGYVEDSILPRLYREAPVNSTWEGSGNVQCLDVLRALSKEPGVLEALFVELGDGHGDRRLARHIEQLKSAFMDTQDIQYRARQLTEDIAVALQAKLLLEARLAACVNVIPAIQSIYCWQQKVEQSEECQLLIKSHRELFEPLRAFLRQHHPYETPEILALPVVLADDLTLANLECSFSPSRLESDSEYAFCGDPKYVQSLVQGGVEAVTLSNNHTRDFGDAGLRDTEAALAEYGVAGTISTMSPPTCLWISSATALVLPLQEKYATRIFLPLLFIA